MMVFFLQLRRLLFLACCGFIFSQSVTVTTAFSTRKHSPQTRQVLQRFPKTYLSRESKRPFSRINDACTRGESTALMLSGGAMAATGAATTASGGVLGAVSSFMISFPIISSMLICGIKGCAADAVAQRFDTGSDVFSLRRNLAYIVYSATFLGLACEILYNRLYPSLFGRGNGVRPIGSMLAFDMLISSLLIYLPAIYFVKALFFGDTMKSAAKTYLDDIRNKALLTTYWKIWVPVQCVTFSIIPDHLKVFFIACVSFFWVMILSCIESNKAKQT
mmetsp:Transcript_15348/g.21378  ORF Transcript_15348/g.21378 Transcript_15348/m.21378 type:complete len:276 (-) Transcript_15348:217-1044(-)